MTTTTTTATAVVMLTKMTTTTTAMRMDRINGTKHAQSDRSEMGEAKAEKRNHQNNETRQ